jgi:OOP family OmpA-OmpF porin
MTIERGFSVLVALGFLVAMGGCGGAAPPAASPTTASAAPPTADDSDDDGVPDDVDKCPGKKEDGLGADPKDGCPKG